MSMMPPTPARTPLEALLASPRMGLEAYDAEGNLLQANDAARKMFGMERHLPDYNIFKSPYVDQSLKNALKTGETYLQYL